MNSTINKYFYAALLFFIFFATILIFAGNNPFQFQYEKEGFLPGVNILLNSQNRNLRIAKEAFIDSSRDYLTTIMRKSGLF